MKCLSEYSLKNNAHSGYSSLIAMKPDTTRSTAEFWLFILTILSIFSKMPHLGFDFDRSKILTLYRRYSLQHKNEPNSDFFSLTYLIFFHFSNSSAFSLFLYLLSLAYVSASHLI